MVSALRAEKVALWLACGLSRIGLLLLLLFAVATLFDGLARSLANAPIDAVRDLGELVVAVSISCCFPQAFLERRNIVVSFLDSLVGPRVTRWADGLAAVSVAVALLLFAWQFAIYARSLVEAQEVTALLEVPKAPFWFVVDANLWLTFAAQLLVIAKVLSPATSTAR